MKQTQTFFFHFLNWCPGALGLFLRKRFFPQLFGQCGNNVLFGRFICARNPKQIFIGDHVVVSDRVTLDAGPDHTQEPKTAIHIKDHVFIGIETTIKSLSAPVTLGPGANLSSYCRLLANTPIEIGSDTLLAAYCQIGAESKNTQTSAQGIIIGSGCWLGVRVKVQKSVMVGKGTIVGAHANVSKSIPHSTIATGSPAKPIRKR